MPAAKPAHVRARALALLDQGWSLRAIARELGVHHTTVAWWRDGGGRGRPPAAPVMSPNTTVGRQADAWAYLLGVYLGDGYIDPLGRLRFFLDKAYPAILSEVVKGLSAVGCPTARVVRQTGCWDLVAQSRNWAFWLPTGDGRKHEYPLVLQAWHRQAIQERPHLVIRGLIHSDGCRFVNTVQVRGRTYRYPTYDFANRSTQVHGVFRACLDRLGVAWRPASSGRSTRVNRRPDVALLDTFVGPKQ